VPIQVFAHHIEIDEETRRRVVEKAQHIRRIFDGVVTIHVNLDAEKERRCAEIVANVSHGAPVIARVTTQNLNEAIDLAFDKTEAQLRKHKDRVRDHRGHGAPAAPMSPEEPETADEAEPTP